MFKIFNNLFMRRIIYTKNYCTVKMPLHFLISIRLHRIKPQSAEPETVPHKFTIVSKESNT